jgi:hypothetical protein
MISVMLLPGSRRPQEQPEIRLERSQQEDEALEDRKPRKKLSPDLLSIASFQIVRSLEVPTRSSANPTTAVGRPSKVNKTMVMKKRRKR